jgi:hypothetical protein
MLVVRCKDCNREIVSHSTKAQCCGCSNMMTVKEDSVTALDLSRVVMVNSIKETKKSGVLTNDDIMWQEARRKRKVKRLDFEVR